MKASVPLLTGAADVRFEIVPGGHLGMLTGRKARSSTWLVLDEWIDQWSEPEQPAAPARRTTKKRPHQARHEGAREPEGLRQKPAPAAPAKKTAKKTAQEVGDEEGNGPREGRRRRDGGRPASEDVEIGTNPTRRYGSAGSRALGR